MVRRGSSRPSRRAAIFAALWCAATCALAHAAAPSLSREEINELRDETHAMFVETWDSYLTHAYPADELAPISCVGVNTFGAKHGLAVTLIDALDSAAVFGNFTMFERGVRRVVDDVSFDVDAHVSVFEMNIRVLGGLLSAHMLASDANTGFAIDWYDGELLALAKDLGERFLPAFDTPTGIPYGSINLKTGVDANETRITSTATAGTLILEFGMLTKLTGDARFRSAAEKSLDAIWEHRSDLGLVGAHIDIYRGLWTQAEASVGVGVDSFYEYLLKSYILFGDERHLSIFEEAYAAVEANLRYAPWYVEAGMSTGNVLGTRYDSLMSFWPGIQALYGDIEVATTTHDAFYKVWRHYGFTPEGFDVRLGMAITGQSPYPLRPELIESTYMLYKATGDVSYIAAGRDFLASLRLLKTKCGYAHVADVSTQTLRDKMESFFLSETLKYLYLLFDSALDRENIVDGGPYPYVFTTEAHIFPLKATIEDKDVASSAHATGLSAAQVVQQILGRRKFRKRNSAMSTRKSNKFCTYHSLLWQIGFRPAPVRPHNLTERLFEITGRLVPVTLDESVRDHEERLERSEQKIQVRLGLGVLQTTEANFDFDLSRRLALMLERTHEYLNQVSEESYHELCAKLLEFKLSSCIPGGPNDAVNFVFQTKIAYSDASQCIGDALMRVVSSLMHKYAHETGNVYVCAISNMSYLPFVDYENENLQNSA